ncbi:tautomerase family protein [Stenotrophomonas mori]|uniref:Tautomerase family protein n=1 Tax=Stenotrophomonas mori TaxID=2871096 RepID=A0ABT0SK77_9GAMM|nr:tautomerase family protein [Stenotrophomonas mori]MCL7715739.1 tautomerase family protein [Stenotrophomonas mori]
MPILHAHILAGRSAAQKQAFARAVTEAASTHLAVPATAVRVLIHEIPPAEWFTAGEPKAPPAPTA